MNANPMTWLEKRSWRNTPARYAMLTSIGALPFAWGVSLAGVSFFGGFAFAATIGGCYIAFFAEVKAWRLEREAGRVGAINQALSYAASASAFVPAAVAWALVLL